MRRQPQKDRFPFRVIIKGRVVTSRHGETSRMGEKLSNLTVRSCNIAILWLLLTLAVCPQALSGASPVPQNPPAHNSQTSSRTQKVSNPLNDLLDEAQKDIDKSDFAAAIDPLQKVITAEPDVAYPHFQLAYVFTALQRATEARTEYERVIAIDPKMTAAYLNLGILLLDKEPAAAVTPLKKVVELTPAESRPRFLLGVAQERSGDFAGAAETLEGAGNLDPRDTDTLNHLGTLYLGLKRPSDAEPKFRAVLESKPGDSSALLGLAKSLDAQNKPGAAETFQDYLKVQPADKAARQRFTSLLIASQKYDLALAEIDRADAAQGPTSESLRERADILVAQKKWDDAIAAVRKALALSPQDAELHGGLGRLMMQKRDFAGAEKELKIALTLEPTNLVYLKDLSSTFYLGGNYASALAAMDEIAKKEKPGAFTWFIRGLCYDKLNQPKPALAAYQTFLAMTTDKNTDQVWQATERSKVLRRMVEGHN
jgi:Flp pilus assembly protein TadD